MPEDTNPTIEPTFEESVAEVLNELPPSVRGFLTSTERDVLLQGLAAKYGLHVDQVGQFQRALLFMLMGIYTPEQLASELTEMQLPQEAIDGLLADINEQILKPLRAKEEATRQPSPSVPVSPAPLASAPMPPVPIVQPQEPVAPIAAAPIAPPRSIPSAVASSAPVHPAMRTMAGDMEAMHEHPRSTEEPPTFPPAQLSTEAAPQMPPPMPATPREEEPVMPPARTVAPPANLPGAPIVKDYSVDPYREPIQ